MSVPIPHMKYGLRSRISAMLTPSERYRLQIAAGSDVKIGGFVQSYESISSSYLQIYKNNDTLVVQDANITATLKGDHLVCIKSSSMELIGLMDCDLNDNVFGHLIAKPSKITLTDCNFSLDGFKKLASILLTKKFYVVSLCDTIIKDTVELKFIFENFVESEYIKVDPLLSANWVRDVLKYGLSKVHQVILMGSPEVLFSFTLNEITTLFKKLTKEKKLVRYQFNLSVDTDVYEMAKQMLKAIFDGTPTRNTREHHAIYLTAPGKAQIVVYFDENDETWYFTPHHMVEWLD